MQPCETIQPIPLHGYVKHPFTQGILFCPFCGASYTLSSSNLLRILKKYSQYLHNGTYRRIPSQKFEIDPEELHLLVLEIPIVEIANLYGVSKKVVEKRCQAFGIPKPTQNDWSESEIYRGRRSEDQI